MSAFRSILQQVTQEKLTELCIQKDLLTKHFTPALESAEVTLSNDPNASLQTLYKAARDTPVKDTIDGDLIERTSHVLRNSEHDPSITPQLLTGWISSLKQAIEHALRKSQYSYLYASLLAEWLVLEEKRKSQSQVNAESDLEKRKEEEVTAAREKLQRFMFNRPSAEEFESEKFRQVLTSELFNFGENTQSEEIMRGIWAETNAFLNPEYYVFTTLDVQSCIKGLSAGDLLSPEKQSALKELNENSEALEEVASLLTTRLKNLDRWDWPEFHAHILEIRRGLAGEWKGFLDEDLITAIFLQYIGVEWASYFKAQFFRIYNSRIWKWTGEAYRGSIEMKRTEFHRKTFLSGLPDSVGGQGSLAVEEYAKVEASDCTASYTPTSTFSFGFPAPPSGGVAVSTSLFGQQQQQQATAFPFQPQQASAFGSQPQQQAAAFGFQPQQQATAFGFQPQQQATTFGSPAQQQATAFGSQPHQQATAFGFQPQQQATTFKSQPQQARPFGSRPQQQQQATAFGFQPQQQATAFGVGLQPQQQATAFGVGLQPQKQAAPYWFQPKRQAAPFGLQSTPVPPAPPTQKSDIDFKQSFLHFLSTEIRLNQVIHPDRPLIVVQADIESFTSTIIHDAVLIALESFNVSASWLTFFKKFLQPEIWIGTKRDRARRGVLESHALSEVFAELLNFFMDFLVNQKCNGLRIFRMNEEFWFWTSSVEDVVKAWETVTSFGSMIGLRVNPNRNGSVAIFSEAETRAVVSGPVPLPQKSIHWGYLALHSNGTFQIDRPSIAKFVAEMGELLNKSECVLEWINIFNKYVGFFKKNFGKCAMIFGRQHLDQIILSLRLIYKELFGSGLESPVGALKRNFPSIQDLEILDAWVYWPLERGGLGLVNPFIGVTALRDAYIQFGDDDHFKKLPAEDNMIFQQLCKDYERMYEGPSKGAYFQIPPKKPTWDEFVAKRETGYEFGHWHRRYVSLLERLAPNCPSSSPHLGLFGFNSPSGDDERNYMMWLYAYYEKQLEVHFGTVNFINSSLLPMSMIKIIQKSKVQH